jgi:hypothetical protein
MNSDYDYLRLLLTRKEVEDVVGVYVKGEWGFTDDDEEWDWADIKLPIGIIGVSKTRSNNSNNI